MVMRRSNRKSMRRSGRVNRRSGRAARRSGRVARRSGRVNRRSGRVNRRSGRVNRRSGRVNRRSGRVNRRSGRKEKLLTSNAHLHKMGLPGYVSRGGEGAVRYAQEGLLHMVEPIGRAMEEGGWDTGGMVNDTKVKYI